MSVVCVAWSSHVGALMSAASRPGMPSVRVLSSRMLEEPDGVERCLETMRSATALFVFRTTDALWDQLDEGIRLIGKTVPVVCVSYDPAVPEGLKAPGHQKDDQEGTKVPEKELEPLSKESKKAIEEAYEAIQKLTVEELQEESN